MSEENKKINWNIEFKETMNTVNEYSDHSAYSSFGEGNNRIGSIAFFKYVSDWVNNDEVQITRHTIANIRMPENLLIDLAKLILNQHKQATGEVVDVYEE
ncbi:MULTISPECIES: hypothetical protein [unclassified Providencia]|uniref:hypothetical protein n=1 Tax=unclassified Providencia TaxID=2633465 RepID=UPI0023496FC8|nr:MULTISPECIES: hypothetical protein [unclassified Providencia]